MVKLLLFHKQILFWNCGGLGKQILVFRQESALDAADTSRALHHTRHAPGRLLVTELLRDANAPSRNRSERPLFRTSVPH